MVVISTGIFAKNNASALIAEGSAISNSFAPSAMGDADLEATGEHAYLEVVFKNDSGERVHDTAIVFGKERCTFGIIGRSAYAGYLDWQKPVGTNAIVQWKDSQEVKNECSVNFAKVYDPKVAGRLIFTVNGTNATVNFKVLNRK